MRTPDPKQRWLTFVHNHAKVIVACDFFVVMTATFRILYVFVLMEVGTPRILLHNVTAHPTANAYCERLGGSLRRECLDFLIPLDEGHLRIIVKEWGQHYNRGRPHSSIGLAFRNPVRRVFRPVTTGTRCQPDTSQGKASCD